jgi:hypothetical protein
MIDPFDETSIKEAEEITGLAVKSCLVLEDEFEEYCGRYYGVAAD